jgi:IclR family pca regulon transcriptional regulator
MGSSSGRVPGSRRHRLDDVERSSSDYVKSLERGLAVIRAFDADHAQLTLSEVARATRLNRATSRRFLLTLTELGYVHTDGRVFSLRPRVLELGYAYLSGLRLTAIAPPHIETLVADVRESSSISVLDTPDVVYVARVPTQRIMTVAISIGTRFPAYATSMGRVLLAGLPAPALKEYLEDLEIVSLTDRTVTNRAALDEAIAEARDQGWAIVDQELENGLRSVAVPIRDHTGRPIAAMNLSTHASRATVTALRRDFLPRLLATADKIEADLNACTAREQR